MDSIICGEFYPDQFGSGPLGEYQLALVHSFRGGQSISIIAYSMVPDGGYTEKNGRGKAINYFSQTKSHGLH
jgi:hypothetical protein